MRDNFLKITWRRERKEIYLILALCLLVSLVMGPALTGIYPMFGGEVAYEWFPWMTFIARSLARGIVPWWDPHTFCGGIPVYLRGAAPQLLLLFPLLKLADSTQPTSVYWWGLLFPVWLGYLFCAAGAYLLGRKGFQLNRPGAAFLALVFGLGPPAVNAFHKIWALAVLPWWTLAIVIYLRRRRPVYLAGGALLFGVLSFTGARYVICGHAYALLLLIGIGIWERGALRLRRGSGAVSRCFWMMVLGMVVAAPYWGSQGELIWRFAYRHPPSFGEVVGNYNSFNLRYFASMFVPWLFGGAGRAHAWNVVKSGGVERLVIQGFSVMALAYLALLGMGHPRGFRKNVEERYPLKLWIMLSLGIACFTLLMTIARRIEYLAILLIRLKIPAWLFGDQWHLAFSFAVACLSAIGVSSLTSGRLIFSRRSALIYICLVGLVVGAAVFWPYYDEGPEILWSPAGRELVVLKETAWFIKGPLLYCVLGMAALLFLFSRRGRPWCRWLLPTLAAVEIISLALGECYFKQRPKLSTGSAEELRSMVKARLSELPFFSGPGNSPLTRFDFSQFEQPRDSASLYRIGYFRSIFDNTAWTNGSLSLLGFPSRGFDGRLKRKINPFASSFPGELLLTNFPKGLSNMSVRHLWTVSETPPGSDFIPAPSENDLGLYLYRNHNALPRVFTLDRLHPASSIDARINLILGDSRSIVSIEGSYEELEEIMNKLAWPIRSYYDEGIKPPEVRHFNDLQRVNRILKTDFSNPNQLEVEIDVLEPSMLVVTDARHPGWRATMDGKKTHIYKVNYLQRGIWLDKGEHRVKMRFYPLPVYGGMILSLLGLGIVGLLARKDLRLQRGEDQGREGRFFPGLNRLKKLERVSSSKRG